MDNRIRTIEEDAFASCHDLEQIIYHGTKAEWRAISKQDQWDDDTPNYVIQCQDGILQKES